MVECNDRNCHIHGELSVRGGRSEGVVVSTKSKHTAIVERDATKFLSKYKRYAKERSKIAVHAPSCLGVKTGDIVEIGETRRISRTKSWTILNIVKK